MPKDKSKRGWRQRSRTAKFSLTQQAQWFLLVHDLLAVGFSLRHAIQFTATMKPRLSPILNRVDKELAAGESFSTGLRPFINADLYYQLLLAERHGNLGTTLGEIGTLLTATEEQRRKLRGLLRYPLLLLGLLALVVAGLATFVYPELASWQVGQEESGLKTVGIEIALYLAVAILVATSFQLWHWHHLTPRQRLVARCHWPVVGPCYKLYYRYYLTSNLAVMLCHGLSLKEIIAVTRQFDSNSLLYQFSQVAGVTLARGDRLESIVRDYPFIPSELAIFINKGATMATLGDELAAFARVQFKRLTRQIEGLLVWVQPLAFGLIALVIVALYLSILLPIYHSMQGVV